MYAGPVVCCPLVSHVEYAPTGQTDRQTDGRMDGRQTVTLRVWLDAVSLIKCRQNVIICYRVCISVYFSFFRYRLKCTRTWLYLHMHFIHLLFGIYCMCMCDVYILIQYNTIPQTVVRRFVGYTTSLWRFRPVLSRPRNVGHVLYI